jgi:hypothetical protein
MGYKRLKPTEKLNSLPARYRQDQRIASWDLDWRTPIGIRVMGELLTLATDLGGWENLSRQKQILVEKVVFLYLKTGDYETALFKGETLPFDAGTYSNKVNVLLGHLRTLGLDRVAKNARTLRDIMGSAA